VAAPLLGLLLVMSLLLGQAWAATPWQVGVDPTYPPFEMQAADTGELTGLDVELMREIGRRSGHPIQFVTLPFSGLIPALQSRNLDAAASAMTITAERAQTVAFSRPYFAAGLASGAARWPCRSAPPAPRRCRPYRASRWCSSMQPPWPCRN
jgi:arginine/lysine/histidine/glutamine transport system substrate-binding/permease protein